MIDGCNWDGETENIVFSVIIPHRDSVQTLSRLLDSIPDIQTIEILVVDNSATPLQKKDVASLRTFALLYSNYNAYSGGAINLGIAHSRGKWIIVADADDAFTSQAFKCYSQKQHSPADIIFFKSQSSFEGSQIVTSRGERYSQLVQNYISNPTKATMFALNSVSLCGRMIRRQYVVENHFCYDEIVSGYDINFAIKLGVNTIKIEAVDEYVYVVTESSHSLSKRREYPYVSARYWATLEANKYLRERNLSQYQRSIMYNFLYCCRYGLRPACKAIKLLFHYKQNPFIGWRNWWGTVKRLTSH